MEKLDLAGRLVGPDEPPYFIAEIGSNHNGDMTLCKRMIDEAQRCGADAVKFQSWSRTSLISAREYERNVSYSDKKKHFGSLAEMVSAYEFTEAMHREVADYCLERGVTFLSTPFAPEEVDLLESLNVAAYKVASMDVNHPLLLEYIAKTGKPVILSTGMASLSEVAQAVATLQQHKSGPVALLHCISIYPPAYPTIHLRNIPMLAQTFSLPVGFSDHSLGVAIPLAAIALGACIIEKHFTLDKDMEGWDHAISADPAELETLATEGRNVFAALGHSVRTVSSDELEKRKKFRRRVVLKGAVHAGQVLRLEHLDFKRPGTGIHPDEYGHVVGRAVKNDLAADHELEWSDLV